MTQRYLMLVLADAKHNNNKFYEIRMEENGDVHVRYGRVDGGEQKAIKGNGSHVFERVAREKKAKGYKEVDVVLKDDSGKAKKSLSEVAKRDVVGNDPVLAALIERLIAINRHELMAASGGRITIVDGQVRTPVGLITMANVTSAKNVLADIQKLVETRKSSSPKYTDLLNQYLTLVPQKVPRAAGWGPSFFDNFTSFQRQSDLLEQLEASISALDTAPKDENEEKIPDERLFAYSIKPVQDKKIIKKVEEFYRSQINARHVSSKLRLKAVYDLVNPEAHARYAQAKKRVGNEMRLWHGTRACNLLSIFKSGLIIPRTAGGNFTISGRMFGDGLYFSDQSTKSLNYSYGFWGHGGYDSNCFMFLCDVAMGKVYTPSHSGNAKKAGYDSCFAKAGHSGVQNNEMIVYDIDQAALRYLCEFEEA